TDSEGATASETVTITITGDNDGVSITSGTQGGQLGEDAAASIGGTIAFTDVDLIDSHTRTVTPPAGPLLGTFTAAAVSEAAGAADGTVGWTYAVNNAAAQYLAVGESVVETYVVTISDGHGETAAQSVSVTIVGANDGVSIGAGTVEGDVTEDALPTRANGSFAFGDVDSSDTHSVTVTPAGSGYLGTLGALVTNDSTGDGSGQVNWRFAVDNAAIQFLAEGETVVQTYTLTVGDGHAGGSATETVTITITGANDGPLVTAGGDVAGDVTEDVLPTRDSGSFGFTDVDLADPHRVSVTAN